MPDLGAPIDDAALGLALRLADAAGEVIRPYFRKRIDVTDKGAAKNAAFDPVTEADRGAERAMRAILERERPSSASRACFSKAGANEPRERYY
jgi:myo-inositol-1(or 4)-monophosphatase